jgi:hypothetical protein
MWLNLRRSRIWIGAPCTLTVPGTVVRVVNSTSDTSECVPVSFDIKVDCKICKLVFEIYRQSVSDLSNGGEPNESKSTGEAVSTERRQYGAPHRCNTRSGDIKANTCTSATTSTTRIDKLSPELC